MQVRQSSLEPGHLLHDRLFSPPIKGHRQLKSRHPFVPAALELLNDANQSGTNAARWADGIWNTNWTESSSRLRGFIAEASTSPTGICLPRLAWVKLNRLRTGVGLFRSIMHKWGMASTAACECGAEEQAADHVITSCPIYHHPNGIHGLTT